MVKVQTYFKHQAQFTTSVIEGLTIEQGIGSQEDWLPTIDLN
jgi:hypothetical protein